MMPSSKEGGSLYSLKVGWQEYVVQSMGTVM